MKVKNTFLPILFCTLTLTVSAQIPKEAFEVTKPFGVNSYPTKLLVSPDNKFLVIPFNVNWEEYMRNYCLIE